MISNDYIANYAIKDEQFFILSIPNTISGSLDAGFSPSFPNEGGMVLRFLT
jgi:hypothetical protein